MIKPQERVVKFEKMAFGLFVHWGLYSQLGMGEWTYLLHDRKMNEYSKLKNTFTAEDFDAEELVLLAKNTGCRYITFTTRHHEGFSLYNTCGLNEFDSLHSPARRDIIEEFVNTCRKHDIQPFLYHTTLDWYNEDFKNNFSKYLKYLGNSVEILCTKYGKIGGMWFDGDWSKPDADWKHDELYGIIRKHQPDAMIINNSGIFKRGELTHKEIDSVTFEQGKPVQLNYDKIGRYVSAEMCCTLNGHWGYSANDFNYKSPEELIECLCDCRKVGANFLLNIGLGPQGNIIGIQKELLGVLGDWMNIFGEAIYEGRPYSCFGSGRNFILKGNDSLYLFCYKLGRKGNKNVTISGEYSGVHAFSGISDKIASVEWMDNREKLNFRQNDDWLTVDFTGMPYGSNYCVRVAKAKLLH